MYYALQLQIILWGNGITMYTLCLQWLTQCVYFCGIQDCVKPDDKSDRNMTTDRKKYVFKKSWKLLQNYSQMNHSWSTFLVSLLILSFSRITMYIKVFNHLLAWVTKHKTKSILASCWYESSHENDTHDLPVNKKVTFRFCIWLSATSHFPHFRCKFPTDCYMESILHCHPMVILCIGSSSDFYWKNRNSKYDTKTRFSYMLIS